MCTLLLIRHATNDWVTGRLAGWTPGVHLNNEGKQQAQALSHRLSHVTLAAIYSSPLERARETAEAVAAPHALPVQILETIGEVQYGDWTGGELKQLAKDALWTGIQHYPSGTRFPGGETLAETQRRAVATLDTLREQYTKKQIIAIVSHADVIKLVVAHYIGMHIDLFQRLVINPASLTALVFEAIGPRLVSFNDTGSLEHLRVPPSHEQEQDV